jgi:hypothetical protein
VPIRVWGFFFMPTLFKAQNGLENHQKLNAAVRGLLRRVWGARVRGNYGMCPAGVPFVGGSSEEGVVVLPF